MLTRGWWKNCYMLAVVDHIPWATLSVLFGRDVDAMTKLHGNIHMNAPSWAGTYIQ